MFEEVVKEFEANQQKITNEGWCFTDKLPYFFLCQYSKNSNLPKKFLPGQKTEKSEKKPEVKETTKESLKDDVPQEVTKEMMATFSGKSREVRFNIWPVSNDDYKV